MTFKLPRSRLVGVAAGPTALAVYLFAIALSDFLEETASLGTYLVFLGGLLSLALVARLISARLTVENDTVRCEGVLSGWAIHRRDADAVEIDRRMLGWDGLTVVLRDGTRKRLPLVLCALERPALEKLKQDLNAALEG